MACEPQEGWTVEIYPLTNNSDGSTLPEGFTPAEKIPDDEENSNIDFDNQSSVFKIRPIELSLNINRVKYDYCRAKFPVEVGEMMKPHTRYKNGALYGVTLTIIKYNNTSVRELIFRPDWVRYGQEFTTIEFHDVHKSLNTGLINIQKEYSTAKEAYREVIEQSNSNLINTITFEDYPEGLPDEIEGGKDVAAITGSAGSYPVRSQNNGPEVQDGIRQIDSKHAVDFENISPEKAIQRLNSKFKVQSWYDGILHVGLPRNERDILHLAAPDDNRVWRYKDVDINHHREPIHKALVKGEWVDAPGMGGVGDFFDEVGKALTGDENDRGAADVKVLGHAEREDISYGTTVMTEMKGASEEAIPHVAESVLREEMMKHRSGTVEIDPEASGSAVSKVTDIAVGDTINIVPTDSHFENPQANSGVIGENEPDITGECGGFVANEAYVISGITHKVPDNDDWEIELDLAMIANANISTDLGYYDPQSNKKISEKEFDNSAQGPFDWFEGL